MTQDIRIYLFYAVPGSPLEVAAFRDVGTAVQSWKHERERSNDLAGLIFAGSSRPSIIEVQRILKSWHGFLLVSESCRWLLSKTMDVFDIPVEGIEEGKEFPEMTVYLGSHGWGYDEAHARIRLRGVLPDKCKMETVALERPAGCADPTALDEISRLLAIVGTTDPFSIARHLPAWALDISLERLPLTVRCSNVLRNQGLVSLRDLGRYSRDEASGWKNFGRQSITDLAEAITTYLRMMPNAGNIVSDGEANQLSPLLVCVRSSIASMSKRDREIWKGRLGLDGTRKTLEELAQAFEVTRERIRQVEVGILKTYARSNEWVLTISSRIENLLRGRKEPLYVDLIEVEDPWFTGMDSQSELLKGLLYYFSPDRLQVCEIQGRAVVSTLDSKTWTAYSRNAITLLKSYLVQGLTREEAETIARASIADVAPELGDLLVSEITHYLHYRGENGSERLVSVGLGLTATIRAILEDSSVPLHYSEVAVGAQEILGKSVSNTHVNSTLDRIGALYYGRGRYGLEKHFPLTQDRKDEIMLLAEMVAEDRLGHRQWHIDELLEKMRDIDSDICSSLDKYTLNIILASSQRFVALGRMVWASIENLNDLPKERIEIKDACVRALREMGHPLSNEELKETLSFSRGMSAYFLLTPDSEIARVARGTWGLVSRDFFSTPEQREEILNKLYLSLVDIDDCVHIDRLMDTVFNSPPLPLGMTPFMVLGLAQTDPRLHVYRGQMIGLKSSEASAVLIAEDSQIDEELSESVN